MTSPACPTKELFALGIQIRLLTTAQSSGGAHTILRYTLPPGRVGAPAHYHKTMTESLYVLQGKLTVLQGAEWGVFGRDSQINILPKEIHGFRNDQDIPAVFLATSTPGGVERFLQVLADIGRQEEQWPLENPARIVDLGRRYDTFYTS